ncbi:MAG: hypothetical protein JWO42_3501 [Chloroflexi bacterium]|nr:hypothetical protein [Chloroflexota bacterium]
MVRRLTGPGYDPHTSPQRGVLSVRHVFLSEESDSRDALAGLGGLRRCLLDGAQRHECRPLRLRHTG